MLKFVINQEYIPVSSYFIENYLKEANGVFLKVYLYALNLAVKGAEVDTVTIASELNLLESDVIQAFTYWKSTGMIVEDSGVVEFCNKPMGLLADEHTASVYPLQTQENNSVANKHYNSVEISENISKNQSLSELVLLAQELLSKPLSQAELETIYWFFDELQYSPESILLILDYCISKGKRNFKYIEKVTVALHEQGLITPEQLIEYINEEEKKNSYIHNIQKGLGISDRSLSKKEEEYINKWYIDYSIPEDMILLAYEYCLINTSKLSFPYMNKIIERWHSQGIKTRAEAESDNKKYKTQSNSSNLYNDDFNHSELEKLTRKNN